MKYLNAIAATALAGVSLLSAVPAHAQAPEGPRAEAIVGWDQLDSDVAIDEDGVSYGIGIGYDFAVAQNLSLGVDAEITDSDISDEITLTPGVDAEFNAKRDLYAGGRVTYSVSDRVNLFATAGYTNLRVGGETTLGQSENENLDGVRLGVGAQYDLTDQFYLTTSYRYSNYEAGVERNQVMGGLGFRF